MVKPASLPRISGPIACLALLLSSLPTIAQEAKKLPAEKEKSEEAIFIPVEYRPPPYQVSVGVRLSGKAKVKFSGVGSIPILNTYAGPDPATVDKTTKEYQEGYAFVQTYGRTYNDGAVYPDTYVDINKVSVSRPDSFPADNKTNYWSFTSSGNQVVEHTTQGTSLAYHAYSVVSTGATREADSGSSTSWDVEISRRLGGNRKITWGILFGANLTSINAKTSGTTQSALRTITDYYSLAGITDPTGATGANEYYPYTWKLKDDGVTLDKDANGSYIPVYQYNSAGEKVKLWSTTQRLPVDPGLRTDVTDFANPIAVDGYWQVKGAFMTARFGPFVTLNLGRHFALRASAGLTFTVLGTDFIVRERYLVPTMSTYLELDAKLTDANVSGTLGYYAEGEIQAFLTQRTGLFFGASYESYSRDTRLQIYNQVADLSTSSGSAIRTGITTRF